jgi:hypothetical protein
MPLSSVQIAANRATAGARYTAAVVELQAALVDLASYDQAVQNNRIACTVAQKAQATFMGGLPFSLPDNLKHPVYAPGGGSDWGIGVVSALNSILSQYSGS